jgi:polyisoprenoid-binding protein YceI
MHKLVHAAALAALLVPSLAAAQAAPPDTNPAHVRAGTYTVESGHTRLLTAVSHLGFTTWYSQFTGITGSLTINPKDVTATKLSITIPTDTISTSNTTLDGMLNGPKWFDTTKYPTITFVSTRVVRTGKDTALVTGDLTFHGVTRPETLKVSFNASGINVVSHEYTIGFNATGELKRSDFNETAYVPLIGDDVALTISAAFVK